MELMKSKNLTLLALDFEYVPCNGTKSTNTYLLEKNQNVLVYYFTQTLMK